MANNSHIRSILRVSGILIILAVFAIVAGCGSSEDIVVVEDNAPPFPPDGVFTVSGDGEVEIWWDENWEADLDGYAIYRNDQETGDYPWLADVGWDQNYYIDIDVENGKTYWYLVRAFDEEQNLSGWSTVVFDTPRPEGNLTLKDYTGPDSRLSGYDFSSKSGTAQPFDNPDTDVFFGLMSGVPTLVAATAEVDVQGFGYLGSEEDFWILSWAPDLGWAQSKVAELIVGHAYVIRIKDPIRPTDMNYAKLYVREMNTVSDPSATFVWAYQDDVNNPELSPGGGAMK